MKVAFRVDATMEIGSGHAIRCLTLANALKSRGAETCFIGNIDLGFVARRIEEDGHQTIDLPIVDGVADSDLAHSAWLRRDRLTDADICSSALKDFRPDWLVVDHYALDAKWERSVSTTAKKIMVIDDLADRPHECDILLDQNFRRNCDGRYGTLVPQTCMLLLGPRFALLQPEYTRLHRAARARSTIRRILIYFGGGDPEGDLLIESLDAIKSAAPASKVDVVYPYNSSEGLQRLQEAASAMNGVELHGNLPSLAQLMQSADLAIGAAGASSWERLCLGLPSIIAVCAENQNEVANEMQAAGLAMNIGPKHLVDKLSVEAALKAAMQKDLSQWSQDCLKLCDGHGAGIVADLLCSMDASATL